MTEAIPTLKITDAEWEIMRVVWAQGKATSRGIIQVLEDKMNWKASTIKTLISRLVEKGALDTEQEGRKYIYSAKLTEEASLDDSISDMLARICNKKAGEVIGDMLTNAPLSQSDIEELMSILKEKKKTALDVVACDCVSGQCECQVNLGGELNE